jgi:hypothetical protein
LKASLRAAEYQLPSPLQSFNIFYFSLSYELIVELLIIVPQPLPGMSDQSRHSWGFGETMVVWQLLRVCTRAALI